MYSRSSWGGPVDPFILVKFLNTTAKGKDPMTSLVIFEWKDRSLVGIPDTELGYNVRSPHLPSWVHSLTSDAHLATCYLQRRLRQGRQLQQD